MRLEGVLGIRVAANYRWGQISRPVNLELLVQLQTRGSQVSSDPDQAGFSSYQPQVQELVARESYGIYSWGLC